MPEFSKRSLAQLETCHEHLRLIAEDAIKLFPFIVIEGHRTKERQNQLFREKKTKARFPNSKHNLFPSHAMDLAPVVNGKIDWGNIPAFEEMGNKILTVANFYGIELYWGKWIKDLVDYPHFELLIEKIDDEELS